MVHFAACWNGMGAEEFPQIFEFLVSDRDQHVIYILVL